MKNNEKQYVECDMEKQNSAIKDFSKNDIISKNKDLLIIGIKEISEYRKHSWN